MKDINESIRDIYNDFLKKKKNYKIEIDNLNADIEVLRKSIENISEMEDSSKFFSPRNCENDFVSLDDMKVKLSEKEALVDDLNNELDYYSKYCKILKDIIENDRRNSNDINEKKEYSLNLNYNFDEVKNKITNIKHKSETCLKIFNNDRNRAKQELLNINKSLDEILKML